MNSGDLFEWSFDTPQGEVGLIAEISIEGSTLVLRDLAVYPMVPGRLVVGVAILLRVSRRLAADAAALGFDELRLTAIRVSGAAPGREIDMNINLTRYER